MAKANILQSNFTAGELGPDTRGRVDMARFNNGAEYLLNFIIMPQGGIYRRPGTRFVAEQKYSALVVDTKARLVDFGFSSIQQYILEFGNGYVRFYANGGQVVSAGVPVEIGTPYTDLDLSQLVFTQSADTLFITHPNYPPATIKRTSATAFTYAVIVFDEPAWQDANIDTTKTLNHSVNTAGATGTCTAVGFTPFVATDVGRYIRIAPAGSAVGYSFITAFTSSTVVSIKIIKNLFNVGAASGWRLGAWSATTGYPSCIAFYEQRLGFAATTAQPQTVWMSNSGSYFDFAPTDKTKTDLSVLDSNAINYTFASNKVDAIKWMNAGVVLLIGTIGGEWQLRAANTAQPTTPTNVQITRQTTYGSNQSRPFRIGTAVLFVQRSGRRVRELLYEYTIDGFLAKDLTLLADHILNEGSTANETAYQQEPSSVLWCCRNDGVLVGLTYIHDQEVVGWHRHLLGGSFQGGNAVVESIASILSPDSSSDQLWMIVKRTINGVQRRYIEYMDKPFAPVSPNDKTSMYFVDSGLSYTGMPTTVFSGLGHLQGEIVSIIADGAALPNQVVPSSGSITLTNPASNVSIGLPCSSTLKTISWEAGGNSGTSQAKVKRVAKVGIRFKDTLSCQIGPDLQSMDDISFRETSAPMDSSPPLFTGDYKQILNHSYGFSSSFYLNVNQPYPCTILGLFPELAVYE